MKHEPGPGPVMFLNHRHPQVDIWTQWNLIRVHLQSLPPLWCVQMNHVTVEPSSHYCVRLSCSTCGFLLQRLEEQLHLLRQTLIHIFSNLTYLRGVVAGWTVVTRLCPEDPPPRASRTSPEESLKSMSWGSPVHICSTSSRKLWAEDPWWAAP